MNELDPGGVNRRNSAGLRRDFDLLEALAVPEALAKQGLGVSRIAELTRRDKSQVSRTLAALAEAGLVTRDRDTLLYSLGPKLYSLAARTAEAQLVREAMPYLRRVVALTHETAHLCALKGGNVLTLASVTGKNSFRGLGWEGVESSAWQTSAGRVLLGGMDDTEIAEWYRSFVAARAEPDAMIDPDFLGHPAGGLRPPLPPVGNRLVTDAESLIAEVRRARELGYARVDEEFELGVVGVSAPVRDFRGRITSAINISAPKARLGGHLREAGELTARVAEEFSAHLGAPSP